MNLLSALIPKKNQQPFEGLIEDDSKNPHSLNEMPDEVVISATPDQYLEDGDVPESFWWGDVKGVNYLSWTVNQHVPQYCGSCWAQAAISAFADRVNIQNENKFPGLALSAQQILNCQAGGSCEGGSLNGVYQFGHRNPLAPYTCQVYEAKDPSNPQCSPIQNCKTCWPNESFLSNEGATCSAVTEFPSFYAKEYGRVHGKERMKKEIYARGPITCGMFATDRFYNDYKGGIWKGKGIHAFTNHAISVVGWGKDESEGEYWIVRNSWGTWWGENGFFRITMHGNNLRIGESNCYWAVPSTNKP